MFLKQHSAPGSAAQGNGVVVLRFPVCEAARLAIHHKAAATDETPARYLRRLVESAVLPQSSEIAAQ